MDLDNIYNNCKNIIRKIDESKDETRLSYIIYKNNIISDCKNHVINFIVKNFKFERNLVEKFWDIHLMDIDFLNQPRSSDKLDEMYFRNLKILSLLEYFKFLYLNTEPFILNFIFCVLIISKSFEKDVFWIKKLFENIFFNSEFYDENYINFLINGIYKISIPLIQNRISLCDIIKNKKLSIISFLNHFREKNKNLLKYYNIIQIDPVFYFIQLIFKNKTDKAKKLYPIIKSIENNSDYDVYIKIIELLKSNQIFDLDLIENIVLFFRNSIIDEKTLNKSLEYYLYFKFPILSMSDYYNFNIVKNRYEYKKFGREFEYKYIIYNYFCLFQNKFRNLILNREILCYKKFCINISKWENELKNNKDFINNYDLYKANLST